MTKVDFNQFKKFMQNMDTDVQKEFYVKYDNHPDYVYSVQIVKTIFYERSFWVYQSETMASPSMIAEWARNFFSDFSNIKHVYESTIENGGHFFLKDEDMENL